MSQSFYFSSNCINNLLFKFFVYFRQVVLTDCLPIAKIKTNSYEKLDIFHLKLQRLSLITLFERIPISILN